MSEEAGFGGPTVITEVSGFRETLGFGIEGEVERLYGDSRVLSDLIHRCPDIPLTAKQIVCGLEHPTARSERFLSSGLWRFFLLFHELITLTQSTIAYH